MFGELIDSILWHVAWGILYYRLIKVMMIGWSPFRARYIYKWLGWQIDVSNYAHTWAVVTGCTDGIGRAYAIELAGRGMRQFILIGRNAGKLDSVKQELLNSGASEVECHVFDFAQDAFSALPNALSTYRIGIVVNCAGISPATTSYWEDNELGLAGDIIRVNSETPARIIDIVLRNMLRHDEGIIVNVSSLTAWRPCFMVSSYPASKACLSFMSETLYGELSRRTNIKVQCLCPSLVATKMIAMSESESDGFFAVTATDYARQAVDIIGIVNIAAGAWQHELQASLATFIPFTILRTLILMPFFKYHGKMVMKRRGKQQ